jgi:hypothetical protein
VMNLSSDRNAVLSLKLELPDVQASKAADLARVDRGARQAHRSALAATALGWNGHFPYLGIRWEGTASPALTFYVDARQFTGTSRESVVSR